MARWMVDVLPVGAGLCILGCREQNGRPGNRAMEPEALRQHPAESGCCLVRWSAVKDFGRRGMRHQIGTAQSLTQLQVGGSKCRKLSRNIDDSSIYI